VQTNHTPKRNVAAAVGLDSHVAILRGRWLKPVLVFSVLYRSDDAFSQIAEHKAGSIL